MFQENNITIYTDGSSRGNPGRGGFASIVSFANQRVIELGGKDLYTTNNKMELSGVIEGLRISLSNVTHANKLTHIKVYSDSKYVLNGITSWIKNWKKNNWKTAAKKAVLNQELWQELDSLVETVSQKKMTIEWNYVKGHADNPYNNRADIIATTCADLDEDELLDKKTKVFFDGEFDLWMKNTR
jgi:ribonuclease HI